jgi:guanylate kinase
VRDISGFYFLVNSKLKMNRSENKKGKVVVVSGPSGVGKTTICKELARRLKDAYLSISATTRPKSEAEVDGRDYWFVSDEEFRRRISDGLLLEYAEVFGYMYGTPKDKVDEALAAGKTVILEIDVQGGRQVKVVYPDAVMIFILPPTHKELAERINHRARDSSEAAKERIEEADDEIAAAWQYYDNMVINDDLQQAIKECVQIIESPERKKVEG